MSVDPTKLNTRIDFEQFRVPSTVASTVTFDKIDEESGETVSVSPGELLNNAMEALKFSKDESRATRDRVLAEYGSVEKYHEAVLANATIVANDSDESKAALKQMHGAILTPLIPIDDEREDVSGLRKIMRMNSPDDKLGNKIRGMIGNFQEVWIVIKDPSTGKIIGAANTSMYSAKGTAAEEHVHGTANNIYLLIDEKYRSLGLAQKLMELRQQVVSDFLAKEYPDVPRDQQRYVMFNEQNDPAKMSLEDIYFDTCPGSPTEKLGSKIDQFDRQIKFTKIWGNRTVAFPYVQPGIAGGEPCDSLYYNAFVVGPNRMEAGIPTSVLEQNLRGFFTHSVLKKNIDGDPTWQAQLETLRSNKTGVVSWAPQIDFAAYAEKVHGFAKKAVMGEVDVPLDEAFTTTVGELGIKPPLLKTGKKLTAAANAAAGTGGGGSGRRKVVRGWNPQQPYA